MTTKQRLILCATLLGIVDGCAGDPNAPQYRHLSRSDWDANAAQYSIVPGKKVFYTIKGNWTSIIASGPTIQQYSIDQIEAATRKRCQMEAAVRHFGPESCIPVAINNHQYFDPSGTLQEQDAADAQAAADQAAFQQGMSDLAAQAGALAGQIQYNRSHK
jgi:hypothetical protein